MKELTTHDRRTFLRRGAMGAGALWTVSLGELMGRRAYGSPVIPSPYGAAQPEAGRDDGPAAAAAPRRLSVPVVFMDRRPAVGWDAVPEPARRHGRGRPTGRLRPSDPRAKSRNGRRHAVCEQEGDHVRRRRWRRHDEPHLQRQDGIVGEGVVDPRGHDPQLRRRRDAVGHLDHMRGDRRRRPRVELRRRRAKRRPASARRHGPVLSRGADGRPGHRVRLRDRGLRQLRLLQVRAVYVLEARRGRRPLHAEGRGSGQRQPRRLLPSWHDVGCRVGAHRRPSRDGEELLPAGRRRQGRQIQPSGGRLVGRSHGLLPLDRWRHRR